MGAPPAGASSIQTKPTPGALHWPPAFTAQASRIPAPSPFRPAPPIQSKPRPVFHVAPPPLRPPAPPSMVVQAMKRKPKTQPESANKKVARIEPSGSQVALQQPVPDLSKLLDLPLDIWQYILSGLSDQEIGRLYYLLSKNSFFKQNLFPFPFITRQRLPQIDKAIWSRGQTQVGLSAQEHFAHGIEALEHGLKTRKMGVRKQNPRAVFLYRVQDKSKFRKWESPNVTPGPPWSVEKSGSFVTGGVIAHKPFVLVTEPTEDALFQSRGSNKDEVAIYAREIMQVLSSGFRIAHGSDYPHLLPAKLKGENPFILMPPKVRSPRYSMNRDVWDREKGTGLKITYLKDGDKEPTEVTEDDLPGLFKR
jgi:hypothetical protein